MPKNKLKFYEAINEGMDFCLRKDKNMICFGLGVTDPKRIFGTTNNLVEKYGSKRVFDVPNSENANTGISIGAALGGVRSIAIHQRLDFFLLAMDQLVNAASKWHYMFGSKKSIPITIRLIVGRGWGQGPTHSQNLQSWFYHIPGLKIVVPTFPNDAKQLLIDSVFDPNPVIYIENRWLHHTEDKRETKIKIKKLYGSKICKKGKHITILSMAQMTIEALAAAKILKKLYGIECEIIDLRIVKPLDLKLILKSVKKTKNLLCLENSFEDGSICSDIISKISRFKTFSLKSNPCLMAMPNIPVPSTYNASKYFYNRHTDILKNVIKILKINKKIPKNYLKLQEPSDIPGTWFKGPF